MNKITYFLDSRVISCLFQNISIEFICLAQFQSVTCNSACCNPNKSHKTSLTESLAKQECASAWLTAELRRGGRDKGVGGELGREGA